MITLKVKRKKGNTQKYLNSIRQLSQDKIQVGHFVSSGIHSDAEGQYYTEIMQGWASGFYQLGVKKDPLSAFVFEQLHNKKVIADKDVQSAYKRWSKNLTNAKATTVFVNEVATIIRDKYASLFGKAGYLMPIIGSNSTPLLETGELVSKVAYKTTKNPTAKEIGDLL
jgi:hypothetical protein